MILIISSIILVGSILVCIFANSISDKCDSSPGDVVGFGIVFMFISGILGFLVLGGMYPIGSKSIQIKNYKFIEGEYHYILDTPKELIELDDGEIINAMLKKSDVPLYKKMKLNSYGMVLRHEYFIKPIDREEKK